MAQNQQSFQLPKIPISRRVVSIAVCSGAAETWRKGAECGGNCIFLSVGDSKSPQSSVASEYYPCSRHVPESELGYKNSLLLCGSRELALFPVPCTQDWNVAVGWCLAELTEGLKQKLLERCEVPPFFCWAFKQHNCLIADHFIKWSFYQDHSSFLISSSLFCPFFRIPGACSAACSMVPTFCAEFAMQSRDSCE